MTLQRVSDSGFGAAGALHVEEAGAPSRSADDLGVARVFPVFSITAAIVYFICVGANVGPIRYYPSTGQLTLWPLGEEAGPAMMWYGWIVNAAVAGLVASGFALAVPARWTEALVGRLAWLNVAVPMALFIGWSYLLRSFFLR